MDCARTGWTKARRRRQWAATAAEAQAVGYCGGDDTAGSGHGSHGRATRLRSRNSGRDGEQVTGAAGPGQGKGCE